MRACCGERSEKHRGQILLCVCVCVCLVASPSELLESLLALVEKNHVTCVRSSFGGCCVLLGGYGYWRSIAGKPRGVFIL